MKKIAITLSTILIVASCQSGSITIDEKKNNQDPVISELDFTTGFDVPTSVPVMSDDERRISRVLNDFGVDIVSQILMKKNGDSFMLSPMSLSLALSMCLSGAEGDTKTQLATLLGLTGKSSGDIASFFKKTLGRMITLDEDVVFHTANAIWYDIDFPIKKEYLSSLGKSFDASAFEMDFDAQQILVDAINKWVSEKTANTINTFLVEAPNEPMALANALYFKGGWAVQFADKTKKGVFYGTGGASCSDFFQGCNAFEYAKQDDFQVLLIPYGNPEAAERFEMAVVLPNEGATIQQALSWISKSGNALIESMKASGKTMVTVEIPCFEIESTLDDLKDILAVKYPLPFTFKADFSGISDIPLFISKVLQKSFIKVDQKGSEACAATIIDIEYSTIHEDEPNPILFRADRPFVFLIRDNGSGCNIFIGVKQ